MFRLPDKNQIHMFGVCLQATGLGCALHTTSALGSIIAIPKSQGTALQARQGLGLSFGLGLKARASKGCVPKSSKVK